jgi:hypothetical protein
MEDKQQMKDSSIVEGSMISEQRLLAFTVNPKSL